MTSLRKTTYLLLAILAILVLPWLGASIQYKDRFPPDFFVYPMLSSPQQEAFSWPVFLLFAGLSVVVMVLYLFPRLFGFRAVPLPDYRPSKRVGFPIWFWLGLVSWGGVAVLLWTKATGPAWLLHWSDMPLFWGFALMIDGWVYVRQEGRSLISRVPQEVMGIGVSSVMGWMLFEYLNFFVEDNWFYPKGDIIDREEFLLYAAVISSGLLPLAFEWYSLFKTIPALRERFSLGPKIVLPEWIKTTALWLSVVLLVLAGLFPAQLFFTLWLTPAILLATVLDKIGVWTPLRPIGQGNWTPALLIALSYLIEGFFIEGQNYFSATHGANREILYTMAPAYWQYNLPYVNAYHLFEMPLIGYSGYLPFGVYCWLWWIAFATLQGIPSRFFQEAPFQPHKPETE